MILKIISLFVSAAALNVTASQAFADSVSGAGKLQGAFSALSAPSNFLPSGYAAYGKSLVPSDTTITANVAGDSFDDTCFNYTGLTGADQVTTPTGTQSSPDVLLFNSSQTSTLKTTLPTWWASPTTVPYSGYYNISVTLNLEQFEANTVYFWVDDWAATATGTNVRLFYSGDVPYTLNGSSGSIFTITLTGGAYLTAGSTIYAPRVWTTATDPISGSPPQFCILNKNGTTYSTMYATLMKSP
jgi:hypothetical protein